MCVCVSIYRLDSSVRAGWGCREPVGTFSLCPEGAELKHKREKAIWVWSFKSVFLHEESIKLRQVFLCVCVYTKWSFCLNLFKSGMNFDREFLTVSSVFQPVFFFFSLHLCHSRTYSTPHTRHFCWHSVTSSCFPFSDSFFSPTVHVPLPTYCTDAVQHRRTVTLSAD